MLGGLGVLPQKHFENKYAKWCILVYFEGVFIICKQWKYNLFLEKLNIIYPKFLQQDLKKLFLNGLHWPSLTSHEVGKFEIHVLLSIIICHTVTAWKCMYLTWPRQTSNKIKHPSIYIPVPYASISLFPIHIFVHYHVYTDMIIT